MEDINTTKFNVVMKKQDIKRQLFSKFRQFLYLNVFRKRQKCLTCSFCSYCTQDCNFYYFLETRICDKKLFNIFLGLCTYFFQKLVKMSLENHSLRSLWTPCDMLCHRVHIIFILISMI